MTNKLNIYNLNNSAYLFEDIEDVISRIGQLYEVHFQKNRIRFVSKIKYPENAAWVSEETTKVFNESVPLFKSIIKDIYSIIEGIFVSKNGKFDKPKIEEKYSNLKVLREFNNKLKHHNNKYVVFNLTSVVNIHPRTLDCWIQYKYETETRISSIPLVEFFELFFVIMEDENIIEIDRK
ncbi:hypothetical protein [Carboxylicivirga taeanensis]|uniref:hypothetical protein n=1 Tax=Carboxylicivirga taeanensis TaxID=1416875 RepID=UPI003F6E2502